MVEAEWVDSLGPESKAILEGLATPSQLFSQDDPTSIVNDLVDELRTRGWSDHAAAALGHQLSSLCHGDLQAVREAESFVRMHKANDFEGVVACIRVQAPPHFEIRRLLSAAGRHKLVFEAKSRTRMERVVLKQVMHGNTDRDLVRRPGGPYVIRTDFAMNSHGQAFLIEDPLDDVIDDRFRCSGEEQAANMLHDLALGLGELHDVARIAHNDIKPGNIGALAGHYVLIDLGNCTELSSPVPEGYGRGSLRTRAPELLAGNGDGVDRAASDVWSLGAALFYFIEGRFPLFEEGDAYPSGDDPADRHRFAEMLLRRCQDGFGERVQSTTPSSVGSVLASMLALDASGRPSAREVVEEVERECGQHLHGSTTDGHPPLADELKVLLRNLPNAGQSPSGHTVGGLRRALRELSDKDGWSDDERRMMKDALRSLEDLNSSETG